VQIYQVGGSVRDELLGLPVKERDWVVVGATVEEMEALGYRLVGKDFPVFIHPKNHEEYALARTERKVAPGYHGFTVHAAPDVTLEQDLRRRDLTVNAMAKTADGSLVDPFNGRADVERRVLRHVSPAFKEDPVRILRVARFAARFAPLSFTVAEDTITLMREMVAAGEVDALVAERVWAELARALGEARPSAFFEVLRQCGALAKLFPEIEQLYGVPQPPEYHPEIDTGVHVMLVLERATELSSDPAVRFAALLHDLGKGTTPRAEWPRHIGHEQRGVTLIETLCRRVRAPNDFRELALLTGRHHGLCHRAEELRPATTLKLLQALDAIRRPERFEQFLLACEADYRGRPGYERRPYPQAARLRQARDAAHAVEVAPLVARGLQGQELAEALRQARVDAIRAVHGTRDQPH